MEPRGRAAWAVATGSGGVQTHGESQRRWAEGETREGGSEQGRKGE